MVGDFPFIFNVSIYEAAAAAHTNYFENDDSIPSASRFFCASEIKKKQKPYSKTQQNTKADFKQRNKIQKPGSKKNKKTNGRQQEQQ